MSDDLVRQDPPQVASELVMLNSFLDYHRTTILQKIAGVNDADLRRKPITSAVGNFTPDLTLLGLVKHLAYVERWWFQAVFAGLETSFPWTDADPNADFRVAPNEATADIVALYKAEATKAQEIVKAKVAEVGGEIAALESRAAKPGYEGHSLRWIIVHMIEETSRHNGHADILRETIDGVTGE